MQQKSENFLEFSERTEALAQKLGVNLNDLPPIIGISPAMLYANRTGKNRISEKTWRKLESAEATAGISPKRPEGAEIILPPLTPAEREAFDQKTMDELTKEDWLRIAIEDPEGHKQFLETLNRLQEIQKEHPDIAGAMRQIIVQHQQLLHQFAANYRSMIEILSKKFPPFPPPPRDP
jgi:hypothetical protein